MSSLAMAGEEGLGRDAAATAEVRQHGVLRDVLVATPVGFEHRRGKGHQLALRLQPQAAAHGLDAVHRKHLRRHDDLQVAEPGPVLQVLEHVVALGRHRLLARGIDAGVDGIEHAAHEDGPPADRHLQFGRQRLDVVEAQVGPGAAAVEEELDHRGLSFRGSCGRRRAASARSGRRAPCALRRPGRWRAAPCRRRCRGAPQGAGASHRARP